MCNDQHAHESTIPKTKCIREQLQDEVGIVRTIFEAIRFLGDTVKIQNRMLKNIGGNTAALGGGKVVALAIIALAVVPAIADVSYVDPW